MAHLLHPLSVVTPASQNDPEPRERPADRQPRVETDAVPDPVLSGADAVEKTTYAGDAHGAGVEGDNSRPGGVTATVRSGGSSPLAWVAALLAILALLAYAAALFS